MSTANVRNTEVNKENEKSLKGTLFSSLVFVGGGILIFIVILFAFYMMRV